jgi:cytosine/adenosine deaminase-related metal-dependent hydrolase
LLGLADQLGSLEPGKRVDLVLVEGDAPEPGTLDQRSRAVLMGGRPAAGRI